MRYVNRCVGKIVKVDLGICWEIDRYTSMCVLEGNEARGEVYIERGMHLGGGARGLLYRGERSV